MSVGKAKIRAQDLSKVFGSSPELALEGLASDLDKDAIFEQTGSVVAVADVSFTVGQGEIFVVMGLSGSGMGDVDCLPPPRLLRQGAERCGLLQRARSPVNSRGGWTAPLR